ncbi:NADH-quinone oxidoreductase subunit J [Streptomonospora wellingtoniae]|uniref:NADH-quinone oxidoreductase subunit J n=1 Tax=Streptomonospora wellingtoniae TaxID=3075544 RepID=A0ABU2KXD2_9ACTN|nr:NADH-quinone oxidoreductase subunit J [Streptomonospora sp. DSM 45055]MDT0303698.1 NADH-quinone oxidoreductase subunit J [Streptomonospora sp. DSM 45055]
MAQVAEWTVFAVCAVAAVAAGAAVFRVDSMARATFALLASFVFTAVPVLLLGLAYLGVLIVLMMTMEMLVMAVFMIMFMMNPAGLAPMSMVHNTKGALAISGSVFCALGAGILLVPWPRAPAPPPPADPALQLGRAITGDHMLVMMAAGLVLFATMVSGVVLATDRGRYDRFGDDLRSGPDDPVRGGVGR